MSTQELHSRIAHLEFEQDQLLTELQHIDSLLRSIGFPDGLHSIKETAQELLNAQDEECME